MDHAKHDKECEHEVAYCKKCDVTYCKKCGKEWGRERVETIPYPYVPLPSIPPIPHIPWYPDPAPWGPIITWRYSTGTTDHTTYSG